MSEFFKTPGPTHGLYPHPVVMAYHLSHTNQKGPHVLLSHDYGLLRQVHSALLFFEPCQRIFQMEETALMGPEERHLPEDFFANSERMYFELLARAQSARPTDIFLLPPAAILQKAPAPDLFTKKSVLLRKGDLLPANLTGVLQKLGYQSRDRVEQTGEFSQRGAVWDLCCPGQTLRNFPVPKAPTSTSIKKPARRSTPPCGARVELIGEEIAQIKIFDLESQRNLQEINHLLIAPVSQKAFEEDKKPGGQKPQAGKSSFTLLHHFQSLRPQIYNIQKTKDSPLPTTCGNSAPALFPDTINTNKVEHPTNSDNKNPLWRFESKHFFKQPNWPALIKSQREKGFFVFIMIDNQNIKQALSLKLQEEGLTPRAQGLWPDMKQAQERNALFIHLIQSLSRESVGLPEQNLLFLAYRKPGIAPARDISAPPPIKKQAPVQALPAPLPSRGESSLSALGFAELSPGDLVVHRQYGIGLFKTLKLLNFGPGETEFLILEYKAKELLYVPVYNFHHVQKYSSPLLQESLRLLDKLGDKKWLNTKQRVKKRVQDMTLELMNLYTLRASLKRKKFSVPGEDFTKFEEEFSFLETPDQQKAIEDVIRDLTEKDLPADRLICGDTGFGKTEVALRACFKVIEDGFQVCVMAPTTLLSFQHFERFKERFKTRPVFIKSLNRFTPQKEKTQILKELKEGRIDILIGTHRVLSRDIHFKNLGLLVIDEEHLFGVKSKERLKNWHSHVDTISLSATPIPRSMSLSLGGLRDLSLILTAPLNRLPVGTRLSPFKEDLIKSAVLKEMERGGQIIFIHNRIADIYKMEKYLQNLLPSVRIQTAHGKMKNLQEKVVVDFFYQKFDLLLCTTIMEAGMDFPGAGTLFINNADRFGLSELHQLRGRVGRSEKKSYCYLLIKPGKPLSSETLRRLQIIQENNMPGSGIKIAQYDLELRGAGALMGKEQSGFLQEVGCEMYFEFLRENIQAFQNKNFVTAPEPDLQFSEPAFIPQRHIPHEKARLLFYKRLAQAPSEKEIENIKAELIDFAGPLPPEAENLITLSFCRLWAKRGHIRALSHQPPFVYISFAESTPVKPEQIVKWLDQGLCSLKSKDTVKFFIKDKNPSAVPELLQYLLTPEK